MTKPSQARTLKDIPPKDWALVNGQPFEIIAWNEDGTVTICRLNGIKQYRARRLDPAQDALYGGSRYKIIP